MQSLSYLARGILLVVGGTIGVGMFTLPYVFATSGFVICMVYALCIFCFISYAHTLFARTLEKDGESRYLPFLAKKHLGSWGRVLSYIAIVCGLMIGLMALIVMGGRFISVLLGGMGSFWGLSIFWVLFAFPLFLREKSLTAGEMWGTLIKCAVIVVVALLAPTISSYSLTAFPETIKEVIVPFGSILFALSAWPVVDSVVRAYSPRKHKNVSPSLALVAGTLVSLVLMFVFIMTIMRGSVSVSSDTVSGLIGWPQYLIYALSVLGVFCAWTVSLSIAAELEGVLTHDAKIPAMLSSGSVVGLPLFLVLCGLSQITLLTSLSGGVFVSMQYILILATSRKALKLKGVERAVCFYVEILFCIAVLFEIYYFFTG